MKRLIEEIESVVRSAADADEFGNRTKTYGMIEETFNKVGLDRDDDGNRFASLLDAIDFVAVLDLACDWFGTELVEGEFKGRGIYKFSLDLTSETPFVRATFDCTIFE